MNGAPSRPELEAIWLRERGWVGAVLLAHAPRGADLEDLLQEVALGLVGRSGQIRDRRALRSWLRELACNVARGAARRLSQRGPSKPLGEGDEEPVERPALDCPADSLASQVFDRAQALPPKEREPLLLRALEGLSQREIAELLEISEAAVESRLARARRRLREETRTTGGLPLEDAR